MLVEETEGSQKVENYREASLSVVVSNTML